MPRLDLTGQKFGLLTVISETESTIRHCRMWLCRCECGNLHRVKTEYLRNNDTKSCGCQKLNGFARHRNTHGYTDSLTYVSWCSMKNRCQNPKTPQFKNYGGRGITIDPSWNTFESFLTDMGERPGKSFSLERVDNNAGYSKENCKWATTTEQARNRRNIRNYTINGETHPLKTWCSKYKIAYSTVNSRLKFGWDIKTALTTPAMKSWKRRTPTSHCN